MIERLTNLTTGVTCRDVLPFRLPVALDPRDFLLRTSLRLTGRFQSAPYTSDVSNINAIVDPVCI